MCQCAVCSDGRLIDKRSSGGSSDFEDQINKAGDFDSDAIQSAIQWQRN